MITLVTFRAGFGQPSFSPFCVKAIWMLQAAGVTWQREDSNDPRKMPYAKLPAIRTSEGIIADSQNIQHYLEAQGADFWGDTSAHDRATGHAMVRMAEEHMYFHILLDRWADHDIWPIIRENYFTDIPRLLRKPISDSIRKGVLKGLQGQGLGRFSAAERLSRITPDLSAIKTVLGDKPYLMGDTPCLPDYSIAAMLGAIIGSPLPTMLSQRVSDDVALTAYTARVSERMTPT